MFRGLIGILALLVAILSAPVSAQSPACPAMPVERAALVTRADGLFAAYMEARHIPGATLAIVYCGETLLERGYGFADIAKRERVDPARTLFRIGSVSKTFTFVGLMQLVEQGRVDPDKPVKSYLPQLDLPSFAGREILVRDLFSHRPGFEDRATRILFKRGAQHTIGMEEWLRTTMPRLVRKPGDRTVYSNYGAVLAGMIVETVSKEAFHNYIENHVLAPLSMRSTSFVEPGLPDGFPSLDPDFSRRISTGYIYKNGAFMAQPFTHIWHAAPAGSASATASDMALYMRELLEGDTLLSRATIKRMRGRPYPDGPTAPGYAWGFRTGWIKGFPTFEHGGAAYTHFTALVMVPDRNVGVFVSVNGSDDPQAPRKIAVNLIEAMIDETVAIPGWSAPRKLSQADARAYEGSYLVDRWSQSRLERFLAPLLGTRKIVALEDGSLNIQGGAETGTYLQVAPDTFFDPITQNIVRFGYAKDGRANYITANYGHYGFNRVGAWQTIPVILLILAGVVLLALLHLAWFRPRILLRSPQTRPPNASMRLATAKSLTAVLFVAGLIAAVMQIGSMGEEVAFIWPTSGLAIALALQWIWLALVAVTLAMLAKEIFDHTASRRNVGWLALLLVADGLLAAQLWQWNLITFSI